MFGSIGSWTGRHVAVAGGTSILGKHLVDALTKSGAEVRVISRAVGDLTDHAFCGKFLDGADVLFHLASQRRNVAYHLAHRDEVFTANVGISESLIKAIRGRTPLPVIFFSTALVSTFPDGTDPATVPDGYLAAKIRCEQLWTQAAAEHGFPLTIIRPVSAYGPGDHFGEDANVIPSLMQRCMEAKDELTVWGSGKQKRAFVFAPDVAAATLQLVDAGAQGPQYISPPQAVTIAELATMIRDLIRPGLPIRFDLSKPEGPDVRDLSIPRALQSFPWTGLPQGLKQTLDWRRKTIVGST